MSSFKLSPSYIAITIKEAVFIFERKTGKQFHCEHDYKTEGADISKAVDFITFSPKNNFFLALYSDKTLVVWKVITSITTTPLKKVMEIIVNRRSTSAAFSLDEEKIYVADKSGDLYSVVVKSNEEIQHLGETKPILGHISILLDVLVNEKYIFTADRDEKIRITVKNSPYIIKGFCLGHTEFVSKVALLSDDCLISTSGDGSIRSWDIKNGSQLALKQVHHENRQSIPALLSYSQSMNLIAVGTIGINSDIINMYNISGDKQDVNLCYQISVPGYCLDLSFECNQRQHPSAMLFVLIQLKNCLAVIQFSCLHSTYEQIKSDEVSLLNDCLKDFTIEDASQNLFTNFQNLFKNTIPGHTYDAFYRKRHSYLKKDESSKTLKCS